VTIPKPGVRDRTPEEIKLDDENAKRLGQFKKDQEAMRKKQIAEMQKGVG
jgi:hypothetical protein